MRKGNAFSDLRMINAGYHTLSSATIYEYDTIDLEFGGYQFFNSFRINFTMVGFTTVLESFEISFRLHHGDAIWPLAPVEERDIIGPIDEYGQPRIGIDGEWKKLKTWDGISIRQMGYQVYSVGYVGKKRHIKSYAHTNGYPGVGGRIVWSLVVAMHTHSGKCYDRYNLEGIDGGQKRYP